MTKTERIGDITKVGDVTVEPGIVYVLRGGFGSGDFATETLHVISKASGGEIRGYSRPAGSERAWRLRRPAYPDVWPEMDAAVSAVLGAKVEV